MTGAPSQLDPATQSLMDNLSTAIRSAPELAQNPGLAVPVAQAGGNVTQNAQAVARTTNAQSFERATRAVTQSHGGGFLGGLFHAVRTGVGDVTGAAEGVVKDIGSGISKVGGVLNKPLQYVQHEYRYLHDVEARHGIMAALGEGAVAAVGAGAAIAGVAAAPFTAGASLGITAGVLGAEAGVGAMGQLVYKDSWQRTANGATYTDPHTHQPVSLGRDIAGVIGLAPKAGQAPSGAFKFVSGLGDAIGDLSLDPLAKLGVAAKGMRESRLVIHSANDIVTAADRNGAVRRAFQFIADNGASEISARFPKFRPLAGELAKANSVDQVAQTLREAYEADEFRKRPFDLPHFSFTMVPIDKAKEILSNVGETPASTAAGRFAQRVVQKAVWTQQPLTQVFDRETNSFTNKEFDPMSDEAAHAVYQFVRSTGQTARVAHTVANNFHNADDLQQRIEMWRNIVLGGVKSIAYTKNFAGRTVTRDVARAMGDDEVTQRLAGKLQDITGGAYPGREGVHYANGPPGAEDIPPVTTSEGNTVQAAVLDSQQGKLTLPAPHEMFDAAAQIAGAKRIFGRADDWVYNHVTRNWKRLVLADYSFGMHVGGSEAILNTLRLGAVNQLRSRLSVSAGKLATKYGGDDALAEALSDPTIQQRMGRFMYQVLGKKYLSDPARAELAAKQALYFNDGGVVSWGAGAHHGGSYMEANPDNKLIETMQVAGRGKVMEKGSDRYGVFLPGEQNSEAHARAWQQWLDQITKDPGSALGAQTYKAALDRGLSTDAAHAEGVRQIELWIQDHPDIQRQIIRGNLPTQGWEEMSPTTAWAHAKMLNVRGATTGWDGTVHHDLLQAITDGAFRPRGGAARLRDDISRDYLKNITAKPTKVPGRIYEPYIPSTLSRIADKISSHVGNIIDFLSREPAYNEEVFQQFEKMRPQIENGLITEEDALTEANVRATQKVIRFVHNVHERTMGSEMLRNFGPFWFAQQQAYKRVGRLLGENPGAFRKYQLMVTGLHNMTSNSQGGSGSSYLNIPGTGFLGAAVPQFMKALGAPLIGASPVSFSGSLDSMSFIMPGAAGIHPDVGPIVAIPAKAIASLFPELTPEATFTAGQIAMSQPIWKQFIPNATLQRLIDAGSANSQAFQSSMMATIQALEYEHTQWVAGGSKGSDPSGFPAENNPLAQQAFINKVKNQTRILYFAKALLGFASPLAPALTVSDFGFKADVQAAIKKAGSVTGGLEAFQKAHPEATAWSVFDSTDPFGYPLPASNEAEAWIQNNHALIQKYPFAAAWLMPQLTDTTYNSSVYNEQLAQGIRVRRTPQEFLNALYIAAGNQQYYGVDRPNYQALLKDPSVNQAALRADFAAYTQNFGTQNPIWYADFQSADRTVRRQQAVDQLNTMFSSNNPPTGPMADGIAGLLQDYATYQAQVAAKVASKTSLADDFEAFLVRVAQNSPELKPFILSVLGPLVTISGASFATQAQQAGLLSA